MKTMQSGSIQMTTGTVGSSLRKTAALVGVLYIIGTVSGILSRVFTGPFLNAPDYLTQVSANQNQIVIGALLVLAMGLALAMVPAMLYPILKKQNEALALGYVVFRGALETVTYFATTLCWLLLIPVSMEFVKAGASEASHFQALGALLQDSRWNDSVATIVFILGGLMFYYLLYKSRLIPRWISGWGLISMIPYLAAGFLVLFGVTGSLSSLDSVLRIPLGIQEMVLAVWLIVKGFNPAAVAPSPQIR